MSREVDTRIVSMYFDNKDFEKNAKTTIKTLDELKNGMNLEKATKGFESLQKASQELKLDRLESDARKLKSTFTDLGQTATNIFNGLASPITSVTNSIGHMFNTLNSYITKYVGFDIAGKIVGGMENAIRQLTIAPVTSGWHEYELKMDSIKTIMSGSGESLDVVKDKLEELNRYADQTVYSFSDMTSNIGKFVNNSVSLNDATAAMKGISNAAADAGQGAAEASRAMYNVSQAFGVGTMKMVDWKSLENANMATSKLKDTMIQAGIATGKLKRVVEKDKKSGKEEVHYYVNDKNVKNKKKRTEVNTENFRETLNKDWLDKDTMLAGFKVFSGDIKTIDDLRKLGFSEALGFTDDELQKLIDIGDGAMKAATEVRTFTKMYDALKEAAQSGWAQTLEYIFGDMEEGTSLWTGLNDKISEMLSSSADARNEAFAEWRGMYKAYDGTWRQTEDMWVTEYALNMTPEEEQKLDKRRKELKKTIADTKKAINNKKTTEAQRKLYEATLKEAEAELAEVEAQWTEGHIRKRQVQWKQEDGRKVLVESFMELIDVLRELGSTVGNAWDAVFGKFDSKKLWAITNGFRDFVTRLKTFLQSGNRLQKIQKGLQGVFSILKFIVNVAKQGIRLLWNTVKPFIDPLIDSFEKLGNVFDGLGNLSIGDAFRRIGSIFSELWNRISNLKWEDITEIFSSVWGQIKETVRTWLNDNGLGEVWDTLSEWKSSIVQAFADVQTALEPVWNTVSQWFKDSGISQFFADTWGWIVAQFTPSAKYDERGIRLYDTRSPIEEFLTNAWDSIKSKWEELRAWSGWQDIGRFLSDTWGWIVSVFKPAERHDERGIRLYDTRSPIEEFLDNAWKSIEGAWNTVSGLPLWQDIGRFLSDTWGWIVSVFKPKERYDERGIKLYDTRSPIEEFLDNAWKSIEGAWNTVSGLPLWQDIGRFLSDTWGWIVSVFKPKERYDERGIKLYDTRSPIEEFLDNAWKSIEGAWNTVSGLPLWQDIGRFLSDTWGWIVSVFKPKERYDERGIKLYDTRSPIEEFLEDAWESIKGVWDRLVGWEGWQAIGKFLSNTWGWIVSLVNGDKSATAGSTVSETAGAVSETTTEVSNKLNEAAENGAMTEESVGFLERIFTAIGGFFDRIGGYLETAGKVTGADKLLQSLSDIFEVIVELVSIVSGVLKRAIVDKDTGSIILLIGGIITAIATNILSSKIRLKLAGAASESEGVGSMILKIGAGIMLVAASISLLSALDQDQLDKGTNAILKIGALLGTIGILLNLTKKEAPDLEQAKVTGIERLATHLIKWLGMLGIITVTLKELPVIISAMGEAKVTGMDVLELMTGITELITGVGLIMILMEKFGGSSTANAAGIKAAAIGAIKILTVIAILLTGITALFGVGGWAVKLIGDEVVIDNIKKAGEILGEISAAIGQFIGGFRRGLKREENKTAEEDMEWLSKMADKFTPERMIGVYRMVDTINQLTNSIPSDMSRVTKFRDELPKLGAALANFAVGFASAFKDPGVVSVLGNADPVIGLEQAIKQVEYVDKLAKGMAEFRSFFLFKQDRNEWMPSSYLQLDPDDFTSLGTVYAQAAMNLITAVKKGLNEGEINELSTAFDATPIVDSICIAIGYGETSIAKAVHAMVQAGLDKSNNGGSDLEGYDFSSLFGPDGTPLPDFTGGTEGLTSLFSGENGLMGQLEGMIGQIDTESLVGQLDTKLGGFTEHLQDSFKIEDLQTQMSNFLPTGEDGTFDANFLEDWQNKMSQLGSELSESGIEVKIKPVFIMDDLQKGIDTINSYFDENPIVADPGSGLPHIVVNIDNNTTIAEIQSASAKLDVMIQQIKLENQANMETIANLGGHIDEIAKEVSRMNIFLDTGVLIGTVDNALGWRMLMAGRTGTPGYP